jgi:peptidoglycan/xylan/chitin deacetylase (PgdA/CDA1 family)
VSRDPGNRRLGHGGLLALTVVSLAWLQHPAQVSPGDTSAFLADSTPPTSARTSLAAAALSRTGHQPRATPSSERSSRCRAGRIALTFDDGPARSLTPRLTRILSQRKIPAVFFVVGQRVASNPATTRLIQRRGLLIANHSYDHTDMRTQSRDQVVASIRRTQRAIRASGAYPMPLMRPPYGGVDPTVTAAARSTGHRVVLWDVDPQDWQNRSAGVITSSVLGQLRPGDNNVLLHDGVGNSPQSVAAVPAIIDRARNRGYCFVGLDERGRLGYPTPTARIVVPPEGRRVKEGRSIAATVRLSKPAGRATVVRLSIEAKGVDVRRDLGRITKVVRIPAGSLAARVPIPVLRDNLDEPAERLRIGLERGVGVAASARSVPIVIEDRDPEPVISVDSVTVAEPVEGTATAPVVLRLNRASGRDVTLTVTTVAVTADESDYQHLAETITIPAGATSATVPITVFSDLIPEGEETFVLRITGATRARVGMADGEVTITPPATMGALTG